jgi:hypothetical protein
MTKARDDILKKMLQTKPKPKKSNASLKKSRQRKKPGKS